MPLDPSENGDDRLRDMLRDLMESSRLNWDEHDRIWKSIEILRDHQLAFGTQVSSLVFAIRELIDRIPPENLR